MIDPLRQRLLFLLFVLSLGTSGILNAQTLPAIELQIAEAIRFKTISYTDTNQTDWTSFDNLAAWLEKAFPRFHQKTQKQILGGHSLLYLWPGQDSTLQPVMFNHHMDVVPVDAEPAGCWQYPPFAGQIKDDWIYGRGAIDDKGALICLLRAAEKLMQQGFSPQQDLYFALGHDEETGGGRGASSMAAYLEAKGIQMAFVLDEGPAIVTEIMAEGNPPVALIGLAEKGQVNLDLIAYGPGGHSSVPPASSTIGRMGKALAAIQDHPMPERLLPLVLSSLRAVAPLMDGKTQLALKNVGLLKGQILKALAKEPMTDALIRTKISPTIIQGGQKANVLPKEVRATLNVRLLQGDSIADVVRHLQSIIPDTNLRIKIWPGGTEASPITPDSSQQFAYLQSTILSLQPNAIISPTLMPAGTDSKHYTRLSRNLFRFSPFLLNKEVASCIHNCDERISIAACLQAESFYFQLIQNLPATWKKP